LLLDKCCALSARSQFVRVSLELSAEFDSLQKERNKCKELERSIQLKTAATAEHSHHQREEERVGQEQKRRWSLSHRISLSGAESSSRYGSLHSHDNKRSNSGNKSSRGKAKGICTRRPLRAGDTMTKIKKRMTMASGDENSRRKGWNNMASKRNGINSIGNLIMSRRSISMARRRKRRSTTKAISRDRDKGRETDNL
jgi:hypothetical protein